MIIKLEIYGCSYKLKRTKSNKGYNGGVNFRTPNGSYQEETFFQISSFTPFETSSIKRQNLKNKTNREISTFWEMREKEKRYIYQKWKFYHYAVLSDS